MVSVLQKFSATFAKAFALGRTNPCDGDQQKNPFQRTCEMINEFSITFGLTFFKPPKTLDWVEIVYCDVQSRKQGSTSTFAPLAVLSLRVTKFTHPELFAVISVTYQDGSSRRIHDPIRLETAYALLSGEKI